MCLIYVSDIVFSTLRVLLPLLVVYFDANSFVLVLKLKLGCIFIKRIRFDLRYDVNRKLHIRSCLETFFLSRKLSSVQAKSRLNLSDTIAGCVGVIFPLATPD